MTQSKQQQQQPEELWWQLPVAPKPTGLVCEMPSLTVPNQDIKVMDVLGQYLNGMIASGNDPADAQWNDEEENPIGIDLKRLDLTDIADLKEATKNKINSIHTKIAQDEDSYKRADEREKQRMFDEKTAKPKTDEEEVKH